MDATDSSADLTIVDRGSGKAAVDCAMEDQQLSALLGAATLNGGENHITPQVPEKKHSNNNSNNNNNDNSSDNNNSNKKKKKTTASTTFLPTTTTTTTTTTSTKQQHQKKKKTKRTAMLQDDGSANGPAATGAGDLDKPEDRGGREGTEDNNSVEVDIDNIDNDNDDDDDDNDDDDDDVTATSGLLADDERPRSPPYPTMPFVVDGIEYIAYESELQMPAMMELFQKDLSEPYSIYTYRYFIHNWPKLCFLAMDGDKCVGAIVCKLDAHKKRDVVVSSGTAGSGAGAAGAPPIAADGGHIRAPSSVQMRGYIAMLAVEAEYRKRKIASNLVLTAIRAMVANQADEVVLETEITNQPALRLYENLGFVRDKRLFRYYLNGVDAFRLKLWLR